MMTKLTKGERSWVLYDWANSVHSTIISTAIFPLWFAQVATEAGKTGTQSTFWLGTANSTYALVIAILAPVLGTLSDFRGYRKRLFIVFWLLGVFACAGLVFLGSSAWMAAIALYIFAFLGFAGANIFYDASLPDVTTPDRMDMISAMGFGYGYIGGSTIPFLISIGAIILVNGGLDLSGGLPGAGVKIAFGLTALWWALFTIPYLRNVRQVHGLEPVARPVAETFRRIGKTFKEIRNYRKVFVFLVAYFFYIDGVGTIIKMATDFGSKLGIDQMILLADLVAIQALAFPFALLYGRLAKKYGARSMLFVGIGVYVVITALGFSMPLTGEKAVLPIFIAVSFLVATSQGGIQALSRSYYASLIPKDSSGEFFGFYNIFGKFAAIMGPFLMGSLPLLAVKLGFVEGRGAYSFGVGGVFILFVVGGLLLLATRKEVDNRS